VIDYKFRKFDEARRSPADIAMGLLENGYQVSLERNLLGTITAALIRWGKPTIITDHATITEALIALEAKVNKRGDYGTPAKGT
jgi:hypothetical protein